jgi:transcriptional regulator with XRE-family HTH domain
VKKLDAFAKRLKNILIEKGISQKELAKLIGVSEVTISRYLNEARNPRSEIVDELSRVLNVSTDYLFGRPNAPKVIEEENSASYYDELFQKRKILFDKTAKASEKEINKMLKVLEILEEENEFSQ